MLQISYCLKLIETSEISLLTSSPFLELVSVEPTEGFFRFQHSSNTQEPPNLVDLQSFPHSILEQSQSQSQKSGEISCPSRLELSRA